MPTLTMAVACGIAAAVLEIRKNMGELNTQSSTLKGMLMRRGELQSMPSPILPDDAPGKGAHPRTEHAAADGAP